MRCHRDNAGEEGFYLVTLKASEQAGLTGVRGSLLRRIIVGRTRAAQERELTRIKLVMERQ